jgi:hypothetical protein
MSDFDEMLARKRAATQAPALAEEWEVEEMGTGRALARGLGQVPGFGLADEAAGYVDAALDSSRKVLSGEVEFTGDGLSEWYDDFVGEYRKGRDTARGLNARAASEQPAAYYTGLVGGNVAAGVATGALGLGAGLGLRGTAALGAAEGGLSGFGGSNADLTEADVEQYAMAAGDTLTGAAFGAGAGAAGYGVGKGLKALGGRVKGALGGARAQLVDEAAAAERRALEEALEEVDASHGPALEMNKRGDAAAQRAAEREADRLARAQGQAMEMDGSLEARRAAAALKEQERLAAAQGQAMEADKARAARYAREQGVGLEMDKGYEARASAPTNGAGRVAREVRAQQGGAGLQRSAGIPEPRVQPRAPEAPAGDLDTKVLFGYEGQGFNRQQFNAAKVEDMLERLKRPDVSPQRRAELERYIEAHRDAVDAPGAYQRQAIRGYLARRYPGQPDFVERLMQRFDAEGRALSRGGGRAVEQEWAQQAMGREPARAQTQMGGYADEAAREGLSPEDFLRQRGGGGGSALDGLHNADTRIDVDMRGTPSGTFQTEAQRIAAIEAQADEFSSRLPTQQFNAAEDEATAEFMRLLDAKREAARSSARAPTRNERGPRAVPAAEEVTGDFSTPTPPPTPLPTPAGQAALPLGPRAAPPGGAAPTPAVPPPAAPPAPRPAPVQHFVPRLPPPGHVSPAARAAAQAAEAGAGREVLKAAGRGATRARNSLAAPFGAAWEVGKLARASPAVRARALAASRLSRLESTRPELYARFGASLAAALDRGEEEYAVTRHVLLQTEPEYRQAEAAADAEESGLDDAELEEMLRAAGAL